MAVTKSISRTIAICIATALAVCVFALCSPVRALAEGGTGNLTVTATDGASTALDAYKLFKADVSDAASGHKILANVKWASDAAERAVTSAIKSVDQSYSGTTAQDAADWLNENVQSDAASAPTASSVPAAIARSLAGDAPTANVTAGTRATLDEGYWLLIANGDSVGAGQSGTAAILVVVGGADVTATTKTSVPTVEKSVLEDSSNSWQKQADATVGDELDWRLAATVPVNLSPDSAYKTYSITFHDELSSGLEQPSDVHVYIAPAGASPWAKGTKPGDGWVELDEKEYVTRPAGENGSTFDVDVADLIASASSHGVYADLGLEACVVYDAPLVQDAERGAAHGNPNTVTLRYPSTPYSETQAKTQEDEAIAYTWDLNLFKRDATSEATLAGAVLRVTDDRGYHLTQDGTWTTDDATVTTDENGAIAVRGVDSGTFKVEEVQAPEGYASFSGAPSITLTVGLDPQILRSTSDERLSAELPLRADSFDKDSGEADVSVLNGTTAVPSSDKPAPRRPGGSSPFTGDPTSYLPAICLAVVGAALIVFAIRRRKGDPKRRP
ncbi:isopeptide-forming domain-containing fimbrial protein [Olsenella sp. YH-ols2223]|uniref:Isopeptide-forming domain-containing fimbrial protein n=1 Tax=Olsenella absiana TaxID=3115222 RepID=A0ABU7R911_9ACTN